MSKRVNDDKNRFRKQSFPMLSCKCGKKILVVPDLTAMSKVIEEHVQEHAEKEPDLIRLEDVTNQIRDDLISQIFKITGR